MQVFKIFKTNFYLKSRFAILKITIFGRVFQILQSWWLDIKGWICRCNNFRGRWCGNEIKLRLVGGCQIPGSRCLNRNSGLSTLWHTNSRGRTWNLLSGDVANASRDWSSSHTWTSISSSNDRKWTQISWSSNGKRSPIDWSSDGNWACFGSIWILLVSRDGIKIKGPEI